MKKLFVLLLITGIAGLIVASELTTKQVTNSTTKSAQTISVQTLGCACNARAVETAIEFHCGYTLGSVTYNPTGPSGGNWFIKSTTLAGTVVLTDCGPCCTTVTITGSCSGSTNVGCDLI